MKLIAVVLCLALGVALVFFREDWKLVGCFLCFWGGVGLDNVIYNPSWGKASALTQMTKGRR